MSATTADTIAPSIPAGLVASAAGATTINLTWSASTDNVAVTGYIVKRNGTQVGTPATPSFADTGLLSGLTYSYTVAARDAANNVSSDSASVSATTADTTPPSTPAGLVATAATGAATINLTWSASTDNVGVTGYIVKRNGTQVGTTVAPSYADTGLSAADDLQLHRDGARCGEQCLARVGDRERHDGGYRLRPRRPPAWWQRPPGPPRST